MFPTVQRVLFPTDFSACAEGAYRHAAYLANRFGATLHVIHVAEDALPAAEPTPEFRPLQITLTDVCADLGLPSPDPTTDELADLAVVEAEVRGRPTEAILDYARAESVDLIVMGTHGRRGWRRGVIGSVAEAVTREAPCPVLTVRPLDAPDQVAWPPRRVLTAVGGDALAIDADGVPLDLEEPLEVPTSVAWAARFAMAYDAPLDLLYVSPVARLTTSTPSAAAYGRAEARQRLLALSYALFDATPDAPGAGDLRVHATVRPGVIADTIGKVAAENSAHLVTVGTQGRHGLSRALYGSVAEGIVRIAPCPVLVVPATAASTSGLRPEPASAEVSG